MLVRTVVKVVVEAQTKVMFVVAEDGDDPNTLAEKARHMYRRLGAKPEQVAAARYVVAGDGFSFVEQPS